jgi:hypothetical protein
MTENRIKQIIRKDKCMEIFRDLIIQREEQFYNEWNASNFVSYKFKKKI